MTPERSASNTAIGVAMLRAVHQLLDQPPRVLDDTVVVALLGPAAIGRIHERAEQYQSGRARGLRAHVVLRSRFSEERLRRAAARGVGQLLILGAGLDTFAYRQPHWARPITIFEVDHPASQASKRHRLGAAGIEIPGNLVYASIDFERQKLRDGLAAHGFDLARPAFVSCLGVLMYMPLAAVAELFRFVATLPAGSECVFTFGGQSAPAADGMLSIAEMAAAVGEPFQSSLDFEQLRELFGTVGLPEPALLPAAEAARYFGTRLDGLEVPRKERIATVVL